MPKNVQKTVPQMQAQFPLAPRKPDFRPKRPRFTVVIDPGHGGKDPGAVSPNNNYEKTVVLKVSLLLGDLIKKEFTDVKVIFRHRKDI